ncbi:MAG: type II toxin-antitoxin system RelE/ParE family toxin [Chloroflexi bacterium]|nr:type II toxin-antitoxin system RelE/ParE family toxin [Chloroflexota bacterium]MBU1746865.1 type II toxin-antitoxin system RelE/ParE family toxin [Chloroflexota bacterium]MBU1878470.1 type II toxin-antitoxin system RelE/ParE family toxin [Chloroflexota bacterium]
MYQYEFTPKARTALRKMARKNPTATEAILRKIMWLAEHADDVAHRPIKGSPFFSLHSGPFRIPYLLDAANRRIIIDDIARHDAAYDRIQQTINQIAFSV